MSNAARIARDDAITEALRATDQAIGDETPTPQALRVIEALKRLRADKPVRIVSATAVNYLARLQDAARAAWKGTYSPLCVGVQNDAAAGIDTPLGRLRMITWRRLWTGARGERVSWAGEYYLNDEPITIAEIADAGLAQRPTRRNRQKRKNA